MYINNHPLLSAMGLHIVVFTESVASSKQCEIVRLLQGYSVKVDAIHGTDEAFLKSNYKNARFFFLSDFLSTCTPEELTFIKPDFVVCFNEEEPVSELDWIYIERYLESLFLPSIQTDSAVLEKGKALLSVYYTPPALLTPPENNVPRASEHYEVFSTHLKEYDVMVIQVEKPFCDLPYTVVIYEFSKKGLRKFFTDLFISQSWGVARKDYEFLAELWKHWQMEGEYDLDKMLREATQRCFPDSEQPEAEPVVYRRPIENVLETIQNKFKGVQKEEDDFWNKQRMKKRRHQDSLLN